DRGRRVAHELVSNSVMDYLGLGGEDSVVEYLANEKLLGRSILDLDIRAEYGISIMAIKREDDIIVSPDPAVKVLTGDVLISIGNDEDLNYFEKKMMG